MIFLFIAVNWSRNRRRAVTLPKLDWFRISSLLKSGKRIITNYRDHSVWLDTFNDSFIFPSKLNGTLVTTRLVVEANNLTKDKKSLTEFSQKNITAQITKLLVPYALQFKLKGTIFVATKGCRAIYTQTGVETDKIYLQFVFDMLIDLIEAYQVVIAIGSEAIHPLISIGRDNPILCTR